MSCKMLSRVWRIRLDKHIGLRLHTASVRTAYKRSDTPGGDATILSQTSAPKPHRESESFPKEHSLEPPKGKIYDKKPFRLELDSGKNYAWCTCGHSRKQPFCDGSHKRIAGTKERKTSFVFSPLRFTVEECKEYYLCNCKQTSNAPFCDGTHKRKDIQEAVKS